MFALVALAETNEAQWIWGNEDGPGNTWRCFRKEINLAKVPASGIVKIAVDSKY